MTQPGNIRSNQRKIPRPVAVRLPLYVRALSRLESFGHEFISSMTLADGLGLNPATVKRDLSYFGRFGSLGRGYNVVQLRDRLLEITRNQDSQRVAIVGMGHLGRGLATHPIFSPGGFEVVATFDSNYENIGAEIAGTRVRHVSDLVKLTPKLGIGIIVLTSDMEDVIELTPYLVASGVSAIVNYSPISPQVPRNVQVFNVDLASALRSTVVGTR